MEKRIPSLSSSFRLCGDSRRLRFEHLAVVGFAEIAGERTNLFSVRRGVVDHVELPLAPESEQFAVTGQRDLTGRLGRLDPQDRFGRSLRGLALHQVQSVVGSVVVDAQFGIAQHFQDPVRLAASGDNLTGQNRKTLPLVKKLFQFLTVRRSFQLCAGQ